MTGNEGENLRLQKRDQLTIYTLDDIRQFGSVSIGALFKILLVTLGEKT